MLLAILMVNGFCAAQGYFNGRNEMGWVGGVSGYNGDLSHGFQFKHLHPSAGMYFLHSFSSYFNNKSQVSYLKVSGSDAGDATYGIRNMTFQSDIIEISNVWQFNFQKFGTNYYDNFWTPYFYTGIAGFYFEPKRLENMDVNLQSMRTEGQKRRYSLFQPCIPIGLGIRGRNDTRKNRGSWIWGIEGCWRKTFTDNLDDVNSKYPDFKTTTDTRGIGVAQYSQPQTLNGNTPYMAGTMRGDTHLKDWYYSFVVTIAFRFPAQVCAKF